MPNKKPKNTKQTDDDLINNDNFCYKCNKPTTLKDECIKCQICLNLIHNTCLEISKNMTQFLQKNTSFLHFCPSCLPKLSDLITMSTKFQTLESTIASQKTLIDSIESRIEERLQAHIDERLQACFTPMDNKITTQSNRNQIHPNHTTSQQQQPLLQQHPRQLPPPPYPLHQQPPNHPNDISLLVRDTLEREQKRNNAILFGLEVTNEPDINQIRKIIAPNIPADDIIEVTRDGPEFKYRDGTVAPKFCRVVFSNEISKRKFIKTINSNRDDPNPKKLRSRPDLSILQRIQSRELRAELRKRQDQGQTNLYIDYRAGCIKSKPHNPPTNLQSLINYPNFQPTPNQAPPIINHNLQFTTAHNNPIIQPITAPNQLSSNQD